MKLTLSLFITLVFLNCSSHKTQRIRNSQESNQDSLIPPNSLLEESEYKSMIITDSFRKSSPEIFELGNSFYRSNYIWDTTYYADRVSHGIVALKDSSKIFKYTDVDLNEIFYPYRDSFNKWVKAFSPFDKEIEMKKMVFYIGNNFFMNHDSSINKRISKLLFENLQDSIVSTVKSDPNFLNYIEDKYKLLYQHKNIFEQIWDEDNIFFSRNPYNDFSKVEDLNNNILKQIYSLKIDQDTITRIFSLEDSREVKSVLHSIKKLKDDELKCKMYFILWQYLLAHNLINEYWKPLTEIEKILVQSSTLDNLSNAQWNLAIAKMYATINLQLYSNSVFAYLNRSSAHLDRNSTKGFIKAYKIELMRAMFWSILPGLWGKEQALEQTKMKFIEIKDNLDENEKIKFYSYIAYFRGLCILYAKETKGILINDRAYLHLLNEIVNSIKTQVNSKEEMRKFLTLGNYFKCVGNYKIARDYYYLLLNRIVSGRYFEDQFFKIEFVIDNIQNMNIQLMDSVDFYFWENCEIGNSKYGFFPELTQTVFTNNEKLDSFSNFIIKTSIHAYNEIDVEYNNKLSNLFKNLSKINAEKGSFKNAYCLYLKADSLLMKDNVDYYFNLGYLGSKNFEYVLKRKLKNDILYLKIKSKNLKNEIESNRLMLNGLKDEITLASKTLKNKTDTIGSLTKANIEIQRQKKVIEEERNRALIAEKNAKIYLKGVGILAFTLFVIALWFLRRWAKVRILAETNNQLGHFAKNVPSKISDKLEDAIEIDNHEVIVNELNKIKKLGTFFEKFYNISMKRSQTIHDEIELFKDLISIEFNDNNTENYADSKVIQNFSNSFRTIKIPTFSIFNILYNSFKWGGIDRKLDGYVEVNIIKNKLYSWIKIQDNGSVSDTGKGSIRSSGFNYLKTVLFFWNYFVLILTKGLRRDKKMGFEVKFLILNKYGKI